MCVCERERKRERERDRDRERERQRERKRGILQNKIEMLKFLKLMDAVLILSNEI